MLGLTARASPRSLASDDSQQQQQYHEDPEYVTAAADDDDHAGNGGGGIGTDERSAFLSINVAASPSGELGMPSALSPSPLQIAEHRRMATAGGSSLARRLSPNSSSRYVNAFGGGGVGGVGKMSPSSPLPRALDPDAPTSLFPATSRVSSAVGLQAAKIIVLLFLGAFVLVWLCQLVLFPRPTHANVARLGAQDIPPLLSTTPAARAELDWWVAKVRSLRSDVSARASTTKLLLVGDSITQGWGEQGLPALQRYLEQRWAPLNLGVSGDQTQHVLWRLSGGEGLSAADIPDPFEATEASAAAGASQARTANGAPAVALVRPRASGAGELAPVGRQCRLAVLLLGTNNSRWGSRSLDTVYGLRKIIALLQAHLGPGAHILVLTLFPRADWEAPFLLNQGVNSMLLGTESGSADADNLPLAFTEAELAELSATAAASATDQPLGMDAIAAVTAARSVRTAFPHSSALHDPAAGIYVYDLSGALTLTGMPVSPAQGNMAEVDAQLDLAQFYNKDKLHLSAGGYEAWARALVPLLAKHERMQAKQAEEANVHKAQRLAGGM
jgi:lysophospholipase L1-like esterase